MLEQCLSFLVGSRRGVDRNVHPAHTIYLVVIDFREDDLLTNAEAVVPSAIEGLAIDALEVAHSWHGDPDQSVEECMALMTDKRARHLPVVDHKRVIGLVSIGDLVKAMISEQQVLIDQLQHYITG